jgi:hypothetical protein
MGSRAVGQLQFQTLRHEDCVSITEVHLLQAVDSFQRQFEDIRQSWTFVLIARLICESFFATSTRVPFKKLLHRRRSFILSNCELRPPLPPECLEG